MPACSADSLQPRQVHQKALEQIWEQKCYQTLLKCLSLVEVQTPVDPGYRNISPDPRPSLFFFPRENLLIGLDKFSWTQTVTIAHGLITFISIIIDSLYFFLISPYHMQLHSFSHLLTNNTECLLCAKHIITLSSHPSSEVGAIGIPVVQT